MKGLIKLRPGGQISLPAIKPIRWVGDGPLIRRLYRDWSIRLIEKLARPILGVNEYFLIRYLKMTPQTYQEFLSAQRSLEKEFVRRSIYEMQTHPERVQHVRWVSAIDDESFV